MPVWPTATAVASLRSLLSDGAADKFEFKVNVIPSPDGLTTRFFAGQVRLVPDTLIVYKGGEDVTDDVTAVDPVKGTFTLTPAPSGVEVQAEFYYRWFTDAELEEALLLGGQMAGVEDVQETRALLRPAVADFAAYYAYMKRATTAADDMAASAAGYTYDPRRHPNWRALADLALKAGKEKLELAAKVPGAGVLISIKTFTLPGYTPP